MEWSLVDVVLVLHQQIGWMMAQIQSTVIVVLFCFFLERKNPIGR